MSSPPNPIFDANAPPGFETPPAGPLPPLAEKRPPIEDPVWTGWEVLALGVVTVFLAMLLFPLLVTLAAHQVLYPQVPLTEIVRYPGLIVLSQLLSYVVILGFMYSIVRRDRADFWQAIRWNWPRNPGVYLLLGIVLSFSLQAFAHLLPIPKSLPIDQFFRTAREAYLLSIFGVTFAPLLEELFFRGFLYPVLARRLGMGVAVFLTALGFAAIHGAQLMYSWGPVLIIFMVGLALTVVRARTKSVAASLLIHIAYNGTLSILMYVATDGFRHLEKLNQ
ncbi:MAG: CPBP family intramembrane metalloprotease [Acidobacteriia bacterium]|nr:CPBP family intramembrane metalloprotease [Terriglobia bacterium]